jgi:formylmethanofuran dehydrogenase subunit B
MMGPRMKSALDTITVHTDVACTVCGCVCDDLAIGLSARGVESIDRACSLAEPWLRAQFDAAPGAATIHGQPATLQSAITAAATILAESRSPLIYGLSRSTTEGQRAAVALAERIGATIDTTASTGHAPSIMALQQVGESTCTLGEVKNRADLVIFWGSDPVTTHPRHLERYSLFATGTHVPNGRADRSLIVVDDRLRATADLADEFVQLEAADDWSALWTLRLIIAGRVVADTPRNRSLIALAARMKTCRFGVIFFGNRITQGRMAHRTVEALLQLVTDLNDSTRFYARRMRRYGDVAGADSVLAWQTGYPFGVNFALGYPRYNPGEFTGPDMLARGEIDACLLVGSDCVSDLPAAAKSHLATIPTVRLDSPGTEPSVAATVAFTTAVYGIHRPGTAYRMDEVPIPLRTLAASELPSDAEVLSGIMSSLGPPA